MSVRARSAIIAAMDGAVLALAIIAAGMLVLWWVFSPGRNRCLRRLAKMRHLGSVASQDGAHGRPQGHPP